MSRLALTRIVEAIGDGDVDFALAIALAALEDGPVVDPDGRRGACPRCGAGPMWPGQLEAHLAAVHSCVDPPARRERRTIRAKPGGRS